MLQFMEWMRGHRLVVTLTFLIVVLLVTGTAALFIAHGSPPLVKGQDCGRIYTSGIGGEGRNDDGTVRQVGDCFWHDYQQCRTATLTLTQMGVDTGTTQYLTIEKQQNRCQVSDTEQFYSANFGGSQSNPVTYACAGLTQKMDELLASACGQAGDIIVPRTVDCGYVSQGNYNTSADAAKNYENCFAQAFQHCYAASLHFSVTTGIDRTFRVNDGCSLSDTVRHTYSNPLDGTYSCTGLTQKQDGLHFTACGKDGDVFVPLSPSKQG